VEHETSGEDTLANSAASSLRSQLHFQTLIAATASSQKSCMQCSDSKAIFSFPHTGVQNFAIFLAPPALSARSPFPHNAIFAGNEAHYASAHGAAEFRICRRATLAECENQTGKCRARFHFGARRPGLYKPG
jgi:hypothetical protein